MISAVLFIVAGLVIAVAAVIAILTTVDLYYLSGSRAIADDGLLRGSAAPAWSLPDLAGDPVDSPSRYGRLQFIVFADHSLRSFPSAAEGLRVLSDEEPGVEIIVVTRQASRLTAPALESLDLGHLQIVEGSPDLYGKYNVRVMPFVVVVDPGGLVRASSLVNHDWQIEKLWRLAQIAPEPGELPRVHGRRRARVGV